MSNLNNNELMDCESEWMGYATMKWADLITFDTANDYCGDIYGSQSQLAIVDLMNDIAIGNAIQQCNADRCGLIIESQSLHSNSFTYAYI